LAGAELVAVQADALARGQFDVDVMVFQAHGVVAGFGLFLVVREARAVARERSLGVARLQLGLAAVRHQEHVAQVRVAATREVRVREAQDRAVAVVVAGGPWITLAEVAVLGVRTELHHPERAARAREGVAVAAGADEDVDRCGWGARFGRLQRRRTKQQDGEGKGSGLETSCHWCLHTWRERIARRLFFIRCARGTSSARAMSSTRALEPVYRL
jgi:hypothetical protein